MNESASNLIRGFYGIVNVTPGGPDPLMVARSIAAAGCRVIQLRWKNADLRELSATAREMKALSEETGFSLIVDDHAEIAAEIGAAGVHVGQNDLSCSEARAIVGPSRLVGVSTHNLLQLKAAVESGADYAGFGPIFGTRTKENADPVLGVEALRIAVSSTSIPLVAIGGINLLNAAEVVRTGVHALTSIEAVYTAGDIGGVARKLGGLFSCG